LNGYPIEFACSTADRLESFLIKPYRQWLDDWDDSAEAIHGIDIMQLEREGIDPIEAIDRINALIRGKTAYSDAPGFDCAFLDKLYTSHQAPMDFTIQGIQGLWTHQFTQSTYAQALYEYEQIASRPHRANGDVQFLIDFFNYSYSRFS